MSGRNSFPENHPLFAGFLAADRAQHRREPRGRRFHPGARRSGLHVSRRRIRPAHSRRRRSWCSWSTIRRSPRGRRSACPIVTHLKLGVRALLDAAAPRRRRAPEPRTPAPPRPASFADRPLSAAADRGTASADSIIVEEAPSSRGPMHDYLPITDAERFLYLRERRTRPRSAGGVGIALARPDARVIAVLGDGSSMYSIQGLWSAAQLGLAMTFVIIKNGGYEALHEFGRHFKLERLPGTELPELDFCGLARSQGLIGDSRGEARRARSRADDGVSVTKPILVEVLVERAPRTLPNPVTRPNEEVLCPHGTWRTRSASSRVRREASVSRARGCSRGGRPRHAGRSQRGRTAPRRCAARIRARSLQVRGRAPGRARRRPTSLRPWRAGERSTSCSATPVTPV